MEHILSSIRILKHLSTCLYAMRNQSSEAVPNTLKGPGRTQSSGGVQFSFLRNHGNNFPKKEGLLRNEGGDNKLLGTVTDRPLLPKIPLCCGHRHPSSSLARP